MFVQNSSSLWLAEAEILEWCVPPPDTQESKELIESKLPLKGFIQWRIHVQCTMYMGGIPETTKLSL